MLQSIRDNAQGWLAWIIVGLISIPFALWGIHEYLGPNADTAVAEVNSQELSQREFTEHYQRLLQQMRNFQPDSQIDQAKLKQNTLDQLIEEEVMVQTGVDHGLRIGDALLAARIHSFPFFQENGKFSEIIYQQALQTQGMSPVVFEQQMRRGLLTDQLRNGLLRSALLGSAEAATVARLQGQQRQISYLLIPAAKFAGQVEISEDQIKQYFETHKAEFFTPEKVSVEYVELREADLASKLTVDEALLKQRYDEQKDHFTTEPEWQAAHILIKTDAGKDEAAAKQQAEDLTQRAKSGEDFAELARQFSADTGSAQNGGDLGTFSKGAMVKPFEDAVAAMQPGEIAGPVQSRFGYHIIKLIQATPPRTRAFEEVREELLTTLQREQADTVFYEQQENFSNLAFEHPDTLDILAQNMGLEKKTSELFSRDASGEGIQAYPQVITAAFSQAVLEESRNSEVVAVEERHLLVLRLKQHQAATPQPLEEVRERIVERLKQEKTRQAAESLGKTLLGELAAGQQDQQALAALHQLNWEAPQWVTRQAPAFPQPALLESAFRLGYPAPEQALYQGMALTNGDYALLALLAVKDGASSDTQQTDSQRLALGQSEFQQFLESVKQRAEIKIYADKL